MNGDEIQLNQQYTIGITKDLTHVTINLPADDLTPNGATLLFSARQARDVAALLLNAADILDNPGSIGH